MSDQCRHCLAKGDWSKCQQTECFHHENWGWVQLQQERDQLAARVERLRWAAEHFDQVDECESILKESPAASLLLHDVELLENMADKMRSESIDDPYEIGYDCALDDVKEAASRFRKQAQEANDERS